MTTIERDGYKVEAIVGPNEKFPGLDVYGIKRAWINDPATFRDCWGLEPTEANLKIVMSKEVREIDDDLIDMAWNEPYG